MLFTLIRRLWGRPASTGSDTEPPESGMKGGDVGLVFIGPTGSGKSTLINAIVGSEVAKVGHGLMTCTEQLSAYPYSLPQDSPVYPGSTVLLVDTPGFDDTAMHDSARVFQTISQWLSSPHTVEGHKSPRKISRVAGFVYLQDITQKRVNNRQNIDFRRLEHLSELGGDSSSKLLLVTHHWPADRASSRYEQASTREKELESKFWKDLIAKGARMARVEDQLHDPKRIVTKAFED